MGLETLKRRFEDEHERKMREKRLREAAVATRSALRFAAFEANPAAVKSAFKVAKDTPRGPVTITVNPGLPTETYWIQEDATPEYFETKAYKLSIAEDGSMVATSRTLMRQMNEEAIPVVDPVGIKVGPVYIATGNYPRLDTHTYDRLERGERNFSRKPQSFTPSVEFLDSLRRDILRSPIQEMERAKPLVISGDQAKGRLIQFPSQPLERTG